MLKRLLCCLLFVFVAVTLGDAQETPTTQGTDFWLSYMRNGHRTSSDDQLTLIVSSKRSCQVIMSNADMSWYEEFTVSAGVVVIKVVPDNRGYNDQKDGISSRGVHVTSSDTISLYIGNESNNSYDAANVLPTAALGTSYVIQTCESVLYPASTHAANMRASFLVVATEDNTAVQITPKVMTDGNHQAGVPYSISLNKGQVYHVMTKNGSTSGNSNGDFSGTVVESDKPVAVFNGNCLTAIPGGINYGYDHVFEQAMPINNWGRHFAVASIYPCYSDLESDQVKITALNENTTVWRDGVSLCTLRARESFVFSLDLDAAPCYLESDNPVAVFLYNHSHGDGEDAHGDPSMVWISPVEQTIEEVTFSTFQVQQVRTHFVNIVCFTENVENMTLDGTNIASDFSQVPGNPELAYARKNIDHGTHTLRCPRGFIAYVYGIGEAEGYAYSVGSSAKILTNQLLVNGNPVVDEHIACQTESLDFRMETNYEPDLVTWNFDDQSPEEYGIEVSHAYNKEGHFSVRAVVDHVVNGEPQSDTLRATIHVNPLNERWVSETTCHSTYPFNGVSYAVPCHEEVLVPGDEGCDTIYHLDIAEGPVVTYTLYDTACLVYPWFDTLRYVSGIYPVLVEQNDDCDSLYILHLTIGNPPSNPTRQVRSCMPYHWHNHVCDTSGHYRSQFETPEHCFYDSVLVFERFAIENPIIVKDTCEQYEWMGKVYSEIGTHTYDTIIEDENGCLNRYVLQLTLHQPPLFEQIIGLNYVAVATNFWPGKYEYHLDHSTGLDAEKFVWWLDDNDPNDPSRWVIRPNGTSCSIIVYSQATKTLHVKYNGDCPKERELVINCTGYAVDDQGIPPLEIYPNPAKDELIVKGCEIEEVVFYNLLGQQVKALAAQGDAEVNVHVGDLPQALYLLEIRTKFGNNTRLVSVIK